jgi:hypothetical protein
MKKAMAVVRFEFIYFALKMRFCFRVENGWLCMGWKRSDSWRLREACGCMLDTLPSF